MGRPFCFGSIMNSPVLQSATLYFREGRSDKVYQVSLERSAERFVVNFAYGRRGSTLSTGTKTPNPVDLERAQTIFDQIVAEKAAKGYTPGESGTPYQQTEHAGRSTGLVPILLNPIELEEAFQLLAHPDWCLQEKFDGRRTLIRKVGSQVLGSNRRGLLIGLPERLAQEIARIPHDLVFDGECIGDHFHVFDLLELDGRDIRPLPLKDRLLELINTWASAPCPSVSMVETSFSASDKTHLFEEIRRDRREGVVFKRVDAPYVPGRPNSGGTALKHKFTATLSAVVDRLNEQRSVALKLRGQKGWKAIGNVTIPSNQPLPQVGDVLEVRYLYAFPESGVLFQPVCLGLRTDITAAECGTRQLKFKPSDTDDEG
jgi:bifunctional non-homologous end joining protein LigD